MLSALQFLDPITLGLLWIALLFMPVTGVMGYFRLKSGKPLASKRRRYISMIIFQVALFEMAWLSAMKEEIDLFPRVFPGWIAWLCGIAFFGYLLLAIQRKFPKMRPERKQRLRLLLPEDASQMKYWAVISLLAGLSEETAYRGVTYSVLTQVTHSAWIAFAICVTAFAIAHAMQGLRGVVGVAILAIVFHVMRVATGSLYLGIVTHAAYDLILGFMVMRLLQREPVPETPVAPSA